MKFTALLFATLSSVFADAFLAAEVGNCANLPGTATFTASQVDLAPSPITIGGKVTVTSKGALKAPITEGATYKVVLKLGAVTIFTESHNLCENTACPIAAGDDVTLTVSQGVPAAAPAGKFTMQTTVSAADGSIISCITGPVQLVKA